MSNCHKCSGPNVAHFMRTALRERLFRCPAKNDLGCPLYEIRRSPVEERIAWLDSKSDDEVLTLIRGHVACLGEKRRIEYLHEIVPE